MDSVNSGFPWVFPGTEISEQNQLCVCQLIIVLAIAEFIKLRKIMMILTPLCHNFDFLDNVLLRPLGCIYFRLVREFHFFCLLTDIFLLFKSPPLFSSPSTPKITLSIRIFLGNISHLLKHFIQDLCKLIEVRGLLRTQTPYFVCAALS